MRSSVRLVGVALAAMALAGCSTLSGGPTVAALPPPPPAPPPPPPVNYGGFLGGTVGSRLPDADRDAALAAQTGAVASGERKTWKGAKGVFGYVVPGPTAASAAAPGAEGGTAECRSFTSTIFFAGRPQTGHGTGCRGADGAWHVTS